MLARTRTVPKYIEYNYHNNNANNITIATKKYIN